MNRLVLAFFAAVATCVMMPAQAQTSTTFQSVDSTLGKFTLQTPPMDRVSTVEDALMIPELTLDQLFHLESCLREVRVWQIEAMSEWDFFRYIFSRDAVEGQIQETLESIRAKRK